MIHKVVELPSITTPWGPVDLSITNSVVTVIAAGLIICGFLALSARREIVPSRLQAVGETLFGIVDTTLVAQIIGPAGRPYVPFVFTIFMMVLTMNMMGVVLGFGHVAGQNWTFTATAQLAVTATLALITFLSVVVIGFLKNGVKFFTLFVPKGVPIFILPLLVPIELISFLVRPLTLSMRLFGNMIGGHVIMNIFASFVVGLGVFGMAGGIAALGFLGSGVSLAMVVAFTALELVVAGLQAFVFAALATVYLNEVVNLGHGH